MKRLNMLVLERKLSNYRIARALKVTEGAVRSWRKGRTEPKGKNLQSLASYLGVQPAWLLYGDEECRPTFRDDVKRIAERLEIFGERNPGKLKQIERMIKLLMEEDNNTDSLMPTEFSK
jgi:transcriptional regulator with XRE-family HTH domain